MATGAPRGRGDAGDPRDLEGGRLFSSLLHPGQLVELLDRASAGLVVIDAAGSVRYANGTARRLLGREDLAGRQFGLPLTRHRTSRIDLRDADGSIREVEMHVTRVRVEGAPAWLATLHDVGDRTTSVSRLLGLPERGGGPPSDLVSSTAAELRGPLGAMADAADDLADQWERLHPIRRLRLLRRLLEQTLQLDDTATRVLDATSIDAGLVVPERDATSVLDVVLAGLPQLRDLLDDLELDIAEDLTADVGADHLWTMVSNVLVNASKFASGQVLVSARKADQWCRIEIADNGPGIEEEHHDIVFARYRRLPDDEDIPGLGPGLWVVRSMAQAYGGNAWLDPRSGPGAGTRVIIQVPG